LSVLTKKLAVGVLEHAQDKIMIRSHKPFMMVVAVCRIHTNPVTVIGFEGRSVSGKLKPQTVFYL